MSGHVDEETPLLAGNGKKQSTPLPWFQFTIVLIIQLAEPLTFNVIYPFAPEVCSLILSRRSIKLILGILKKAHSWYWHNPRQREQSWILCRTFGALVDPL